MNFGTLGTGFGGMGRGGAGVAQPGPSSGDGLLLEEDTDGSSFLLLEDGSFLLLE